MYCVPYPYRKSAYDAILEWKAQSDDGSGKLTDEDKEAWHDLVKTRVPIIGTRVFRYQSHVIIVGFIGGSHQLLLLGSQVESPVG